MSIAANSLFLRFFLAFWLGLRQAWAGSLPGRACAALERWFTRQLRGSAIFRFCWREGRVPRAWPESLSCRIFTGLVNIPCALCKWLYKIGRPLWDGSLFCRFLNAVGGAGFFMLVMLMAPHELWNNTYGLLGVLAVTALFIIGSASRSRARLELDTLGPYMTLYMGFICIALLGSISTHLSLRFFAFHLTGFLMVLLVVSSVRKYEQLQLLVSLAVLGVSIAALYGCYQGYVGVEVVASQQDMSVNAGMPGRVYSFFDNPNNFAEQLVMLLPLDLALFLNSHWRGKLLSLLSLCVGAVAIGLTYGRSCWIGLTLAVVVFLALIDWRWVPLFLVAGLVAIPFLPETIYNRILTITNTKDSSTRYRFEIYSTTENLMRDHWVKGVGLGTDVMKEVFQTYPTNFDGTYPIHTHNNYLQIWAETGIWGLVSFLAVLLYQLKSGVKAFRAALDKRTKRLLAAALGAFCGILVVSIAEYTWFYPRNMFTYWFLFGVITACVKLVRQEQRKKAART
mgnify:FL=1